jgi:tight adherence protein B
MGLVYAILVGIAVFAMTYQHVERFLDWLRFQSLGTRDYVVEMCGKMFIDITPNKALLILIASFVVPFLTFFILFLPQIIPGILFGLIFGVAGWFLPRPIVKYMYQRRIEKFNLMMVDGLALMSNGMKSGLSVVQALGIVAEQMPNPMSQEFNLILSENKLGVSIEDSFSNLAKRVPCEDVDMFVTSINILKETGGNLAETFDTIAYTIRERIKVGNKIKSLTMQGYFQGMVLLAGAPLSILYSAVSDPEMTGPLFNTPLGWVILAVLTVAEIFAFYLVKKAVTIDV